MLVALASLATFFPTGSGDPNIPHLGGVITLTDITGMARAVNATYANEFVVVGDTVNDFVPLPNNIWKLVPGDGWVAKFDTDGNRLWTNVVNFGAEDHFDDVVVDGSNNVYVVGQTTNGWPNSWGWAFKYSSGGTQVWSLNYSFPGAVGTFFGGVALQGDGLTIMAAKLYYVGSDLNIVAATVRLDLSGTLVSNNTFGGPLMNDIANSGTSGQYFATGSYKQPGQPSKGCTGKLELAGYVWHDSCATNDTRYWEVAKASSNLTVNGIVGVDPGTGDRSYMRTATRSSSGSLLWQADYGAFMDGAAFVGLGVTSDTSGNVYASGSNITENGTGEPPSIEDPNYLVSWDPLDLAQITTVKYNSGGAVQWVAEYQDLNHVLAWANGIDQVPRLIVVGQKLVDPTLKVSFPFIVRYENL